MAQTNQRMPALIIKERVPEGGIVPLTLEVVARAEIRLAGGDRAGAYMELYQATGNPIYITQAEITTYSGANGGMALSANFMAKIANTENGKYNLSLDEFSEDIDKAVIANVKAYIKNGYETNKDLGIRDPNSPDAVQEIDQAVWAGLGMGKSFPGNVLFFDAWNHSEPISAADLFFSPGSEAAVLAQGNGSIYMGRRPGEFVDNSEFEVHKGRDFIVVTNVATGKIELVWDKNNDQNQNIDPYTIPDADMLVEREKYTTYLQANNPEPVAFDSSLDIPAVSLDHVFDFDGLGGELWQGFLDKVRGDGPIPDGGESQDGVNGASLDGIDSVFTGEKILVTDSGAIINDVVVGFDDGRNGTAKENENEEAPSVTNIAIITAIDLLKKFAEPEVSDELFKPDMDRAIQDVIESENNLTQAQKLEIQYLARRVGEPDVQDALQKSFAELKSQISRSLSEAELAKGNVTALKNALKVAGDYAGPAGKIFTAVELNMAIESGNPIEIGEVITDLLLAATVGVAATTLAVFVLGASAIEVAIAVAVGVGVTIIADTFVPDSIKELVGEIYLDTIHEYTIRAFEIGDEASKGLSDILSDLLIDNPMAPPDGEVNTENKNEIIPVNDDARFTIQDHFTADPGTILNRNEDTSNSNVVPVTQKLPANIISKVPPSLIDAEIQANKQSTDYLAEVDSQLKILLKLDQDMGGGEGGGIYDPETRNTLQTVSSAVGLVSAIDNENWLGAAANGYKLAQQLGVLGDGTTSNLVAGPGSAPMLSNASTTSTGSAIISAYGLYSAIQNDNVAGAVTSAYILANSFRATPLPGTAYLGYAQAAAQLLDGDVEGAAISAASTYASTAILQNALASVNPYVIAAAAVVAAVLAISQSKQPDPEASLSFAEDADGNVIFSTDANKTGGGLEQQLTGLGGVLSQTIQAFENTLPTGVLPDDQVDVSTLPNVVSIQNQKTGETQLRLEGGGGMGGSVLIVVGGASELIEIMPHIILYSDFQDAWITDVQTIVSENGQVFIDTYANPYGSPPSDVVAKGTGIFVGGGNVGGNKEFVIAQNNQIRSLASPAPKTVAKEFAEVNRTWRNDKNIFEGNSGQLLAAGVATGLLSINDVYAAAGTPAPIEQPPQSLLDNEAYRALLNEADSNLIVAGFGRLNNTAGQTGAPLNPVGPSEDYQSAFLEGYDSSYVDINNDSDNSGNANADLNDLISNPPSIPTNDEQTQANAQADLIRELARPVRLNGTPVLDEFPSTVTINEGSTGEGTTPLTGGQSDQLLVFEDRDVFTSIDQLLANDVAGVRFMGLSQAMNGSININATGDIQFIPDSDFAGQAGFSYLIEDARGEQQTVNVVVNVTNTNDAPDANDDVITFAANSVLDLQLLLSNDTDADNDALSLVAISQVNNGQIILNADGTYQFSPDAGFVGETQLTYVVEDANGIRSIAAAQLIVSNSVGQPVVIGDVTLPDNGNLVANNTGDRISYQEFSQPDFNLSEDESRLFSAEALLGIQNNASTNTLQILNARMLDNTQGTVTLTPDGEISFTPTENLTGEVTFEYEISNGVTSVPSQTIVKVWPVNDAPTTQDDQFSGLEDSNLVLAGTTLLANDSDVEGDSLRIVGIWGTSAGSQASYDANADQLTFTPPSNFFGDAWVDFLVEDVHGAWAVERSDIAIANVDDPAVAIDDNISLLEDQTRLILAEELTANDINLDREVLRINSIDTSLLTHGTAELLATGDVRFIPNADYAGTQTLRYELIDETGNLSSAQAVLTVQQVNDAPRVQVSTRQAREDELASFSFANLLTNAIDIEGDAMQVVGVRSQFGSVGIDGVNGNITFQANTNFNSELYGGPAVVEYLVADVFGAQTWGTLNVDVAPVNDAPSAGNDTVFTWASGPGAYANTFNASDLLANDSDVDGETIFVDQLGQGANGVVSFDQASGIVSYLANTGFVGTDTFTYRISDGVANSFGTGSVRVEVLQNTAPVASDFATIAPEDTVLRFDWADFLPYVSDQDLLQLELPESLQLVSVSNAVNGAVSMNADGSVNFNPQDNFNSAQNQAVASFDYVVSDIVGNTSTATVSIDLTPVNDAPVANPESLPAIDEDSPGLIFTAAQLLLNDTDVDVDAAGIRDVDNLTVTLGNSAHGRIANLGNGQYRYTPDTNYNGTDFFAYTISDGHGGSDSSYAQVNVRPINDNPVAEIVFGSGNDRDTNRLRDVLSHASDIDGDSLSLNVTGYSGGISSASASGGDLVWRAGSAGSGRIFYDVLDGRGGVASSYADVRIAHVNRPPTVVELTTTFFERADVETRNNNGVAESRFHVELHGHMLAADSDGFIAAYRGDGPPGFRPSSNGNWSIELGWSFWFQGSFDQSFSYEMTAIDNESASVTRAFTVRVFLNVGDASAGVVRPPLLFDLDNNGFELLSYAAGSEARFDVDGDGKKELTSWMAGGDGLLAVDINSDGIIDQSNEISFVDYVEGAKTDLEGLRFFDSDRNGELTANDSQWEQFGIWIDGNADGSHDEGEWQKLDDIGIASIQLTSDGIAQDLGDGNELYGTGQFTWADGTTGEFADLGLSYQDEPELEITVDEILLEQGLGTEEGVFDGDDTLAIQEGLSDNTDAAGTDTDQLAPDQTEDIALAEEEINTDIDSGTSTLPSDAELDRMVHSDVDAIVAQAPKETVTPAPENIDILTESLVNTADNNEEQQLVA